ncbi:type-F conjugative transfer system protein TraW [Pseudoduganella sp. UC29_106]|uniref:type-F conjugative transfer system protein TraW n=1 Tax=Pseudoduganella sp. UC29_106 TaxID=3374553 RepID=UPI0037576FE7
MRIVPIFLLAALATFHAVSAARAESLGVIGPTYGIGEEHLLKMIEQRLRSKEQSGELARIQAQIVERGRQAVLAPAPLSLATTKVPRTYYYDPTYVLDRNIVDGGGRLLFATGTRANPLDIVTMSRRLLFFDARDGQQVALAARLMSSNDGAKVKPVLVGGSYLELMRLWRTPVYYDQKGLLVRRLRIERVPALVYQEGRKLRIDELVSAP